MDYYQGVVAEYLCRRKSVFISSEYELMLDPNRKMPVKGTSWIIDILAIDFEKRVIFLCEVTYSQTQHALLSKLSEWANLWPEIVAAVRRQTKAPDDWAVLPRAFVPESYRKAFDVKAHVSWGEIKITSLEEVAPWVKISDSNAFA